MKQLHLEVEKLREDNTRLRGKITQLQQEKAHAIDQAEELRKEKERLRSRANALRGDVEAEKRVRDDLAEKNEALRVALDKANRRR